MLGLLHASLCLTLQARPGITGVVLWYVGPSLLAALGAILLFGALVSALRHRLTWSPRRTVRLAVLAALAGAPALYRIYPSSHDGHPSQIRFVLPLRGSVTIAWGGEAKKVNAHVVAPDQRWGYDLIVTSNGTSFRGSGHRLSDYYAYGQEVFAPATGVVHTAHDGEPDVPIGRKGKKDDLGNHIGLQVAPEQFLYIAHMQPGSILVKPGDRVTPGQPLGRVGNSGISSEPHVHLHLQDSARRHLAEAIPFHFFDYCAANTYVAQGMPSGGREDGRWVGQIVSHASAGRCHSTVVTGHKTVSYKPSTDGASAIGHLRAISRPPQPHYRSHSAPDDRIPYLLVVEQRRGLLRPILLMLEPAEHRRGPSHP